MPVSNTPRSFGAVTKTFHWLTALVILTAFPLGMIANGWPHDSSEALATKSLLFSLHKTVGVAAFAVGSARILWALTQPRPAPLHPERGRETFAAAAVHWLLYISLVAVPLTGWVHHAATTGFAPIWWPLGQTLPFVAQTEPVAAGAAALHWLFTKLLLAAIVLHVAGALKHHLIDRDATLRRMLPGADAAPGAPRAAGHGASPALAAVALYGAAAGAAVALADDGAGQAELAGLAAAASEWQVREGAIELTVSQMGTDVTGHFVDWQAAITFDETVTDGTHGDVAVEIAVTSVRIGSVSEEAKGADFFNVDEHPTARFTAKIRPDDTAYRAEGTLRLSGAEVPVTLPFELDIDGDTARMQGQTVLDRLDFGIGESHRDPDTVGHEVTVEVTLIATRG